jgi:hypothetical protein
MARLDCVIRLYDDLLGELSHAELVPFINSTIAVKLLLPHSPYTASHSHTPLQGVCFRRANRSDLSHRRQSCAVFMRLQITCVQSPCRRFRSKLFAAEAVTIRATHVKDGPSLCSY